MMRRAKSIFAILVLLSMPLAVLADAAQSPADICNRICCLPHGRHSARMQRSADPKAASMRAKSAVEMSCHHSSSNAPVKCTMRSGIRLVDFGGIAPLPPMKPIFLISIAAPIVSRGAALNFETVLPPGFSALPFEPPRA